MSLLLDTHVVLWWLADDPALADEIKERLDQELDVFVSSATVLIAQAQLQGLTLVTRDAQVQKYDVDLLAV